MTVIEARSGYGSGEITVQWDAVAAAPGHRVLRTDSSGRPLADAADCNVATGHATTGKDRISVRAPSGYP